MSRRTFATRRSRSRLPAFLSRRSSAALISAGVTMLLFTIVSTFWALTDVINVEPGALADQHSAIQPNDLRPQQCIDNGVSVSHLTSGGGASILGVNGGDLIFPSGATTSITGGTGDDCIVGNDTATVDGGGGT